MSNYKECMECVLKFRNLGRSVVLLSENLDIDHVKQYLTASCGLNKEAFRKYKTLRLWEHRQVVHSLRFDLVTVFINFIIFKNVFTCKDN